MADEFDPDAYLSEKEKQQEQPFDPDAYLASKEQPVAEPPPLSNVAAMKSGVAEMSPEARSAAQQVVQAIPQAVEGAQKAQMAVMTGGGSLLAEALTPEPVKEFMRTPLVSPENIDVGRRALQYPLHTILFGTPPEEQGALGTAGRFATEQISGLTTPENIAVVVGTEGLGAAEKILAKRAPSLVETLFGRRTPTVTPATEAAATESVVRPPPVPKEYEIPQLMSSPTFTLVPEPKPEIAPVQPLEQQVAELPSARVRITPGGEVPLPERETVRTGIQPETQRIGEPNASEITSTESVPQPEVRTPVGEGTPLRQQGETTEARQGIEAQPQTQEVTPTVPQPEQPKLEISKEDVGSALDRTYGRDEKIRLETINDLWDEPHMQSYKDNANNLLNEVTEKMKGAPFDQAELKRRILQSEALMEGKPDEAWPIPVYVAEAGDRNTVGLLLHKDGKLEMFEGNDEATPATLDLVNKVLGNEGKTVTVYTSQPADVIQRIKSGDIPEGIFVSPSREHAASYWGEGREVTKIKIPLSQVAQHSEVDWQVRPKPAPQTPAVTEPTTAEPLPKTEEVSPVETAPPVTPPTEKPPVQVNGEQPHVSRIANRFVDERVATGEIGEVEPGTGFSTRELVQRGTRMSPEEINQHVSDLMQKTGDPIKQAQAVRAEEARLSQRSAELSRIAESKPNDVQAKLAADNAFKDVTDFHNGPVAQLKRTFHATGMGLQGEIPVDLGSFNGLRQKWLQDTGSTPPARMEGTLRKTARQVREAESGANGATQRLSQEIEKAAGRRKLPSVEEVKTNIQGRMKVEPCIV